MCVLSNCAVFHSSRRRLAARFDGSLMSLVADSRCVDGPPLQSVIVTFQGIDGMSSEKLDPPEREKGDVGLAVVRAAIAAIPVVGGPLVEVFNQVVQPPLERRKAAWAESVARRLQELENEGVSIEGLSNNEEFISAVMSASVIAMRTHQAEKLDALRNAVFNSLGKQAPSDAKRSMFISWVDSLSVLHIQVLRYARAPICPDNVMTGSLIRNLLAEFAELRSQTEFATQIWSDLYIRGLLTTNTDGLQAMMTAHGLRENRVSSLGKEFLRFISDDSER